MPALPDAALAQLFTTARSYSAYLPEPVTDQQLHELYELLKFGPTSANCCPARFVFVRTPEAKERLIACLPEGNVAKVRSAPVTVIIARDGKFFDHLPRLFPFADMKAMMLANPALAETTSLRNGSLQGAYLILAARSLGLDCLPMSGFDAAKVEAAFLAGTGWTPNFICAIGHGDAAKLRPRLPRFTFDEACKLV